ncbi:MAG: Maf family protein, partial [Muribaculaceae bacterium]|nr:Maf family protein [Muribaculaceae bacterium]
LTADTVVVLDGEILGKPIDEADAEASLRKLSGRTHTVVTGVTLTSLHRSVSFSVHTEVDFDILSDEVIKRYVSTYHPLDKAGAYGIQEWIGAVGIRGIRGSFYNVMGLPLHAVYDRMKEFSL